MLTIAGAEQLESMVGQELGVSDWHEVTQEAIDEFARLTGDEQWIHVDVERAEATRLGGTIAHGYYTLSRGTRFLYEMFTLDGFEFAMNYGLNRVRFPSMMPVGERFRMRARLLSVEHVNGGIQTATELTFEREGHEKPVCVAEFLGRYFEEM